MVRTPSRRLVRWMIAVPFTPMLSLALAGCGADTSTGPVMPPAEQAKSAQENMENFMKEQAKNKGAAKK